VYKKILQQYLILGYEISIMIVRNLCRKSRELSKKRYMYITRYMEEISAGQSARASVYFSGACLQMENVRVSRWR